MAVTAMSMGRTLACPASGLADQAGDKLERLVRSAGAVECQAKDVLIFGQTFRVSRRLPGMRPRVARAPGR